jgi:NAD(P)-dependent dehydrogenase (short-subunit alcohol dehydrogenase family)
MNRVAGKVAFITGAARGQGRSHAMRLAEEGADIIAVDLCSDIHEVAYSMGTEEDLAETVALVEKLDRRIVSMKADVRDQAQVDKAVTAGLETFGKIGWSVPASARTHCSPRERRGTRGGGRPGSRTRRRGVPDQGGRRGVARRSRVEAGTS